MTTANKWYSACGLSFAERPSVGSAVFGRLCLEKKFSVNRTGNCSGNPLRLMLPARCAKFNIDHCKFDDD